MSARNIIESEVIEELAYAARHEDLGILGLGDTAEEALEDARRELRKVDSEEGVEDTMEEISIDRITAKARQLVLEMGGYDVFKKISNFDGVFDVEGDDE